MPKIIVISAGGTIDSAAVGGKISLSHSHGIIDRYCEKFNIDKSAFDCRSVINVLSENMQISDLQRLVDYLYDVLGTLPSDSEKSEYSGIIITHGTDTPVSYTHLIYRGDAQGASQRYYNGSAGRLRPRAHYRRLPPPAALRLRLSYS